ncbi:ABC transporter ATP-binding protein [uncultured Cellulomonas sp.]|uniref:ABC transporter ATP-binding protein n=1 Tax=uncultured Cellulomonas sp. TaxID=189682 RepID=UPI0028ED0233|nr:ABC transporter ATP-binding protein [uncultured Cellulomonas sp.]
MQAVSRTYAGRGGRDPVVALDGLDLSVAEGEVHGLLGPNGAGKTTLVKILSTVLLPTTGTARILGHDVVEDVDVVRRTLGVVLGGERGLYTRVSAKRNMYFWGALYGLGRSATRERTEMLLERVGLADHADHPVESFSRGMKQRLHLARGLIHDPRVLFLDEPSSGMDPVAAREFRDLVRELQSEGRSILLTTHNMAEAEDLCDHVTLIDKGRVLLTARTVEAARALGTRECVDFETADPDLVVALGDQVFVDTVDPLPGVAQGWRAFPTDTDGIGPVLRWLVDRGVLSARRAEPSLEDVYVRLVGARGLAL